MNILRTIALTLLCGTCLGGEICDQEPPTPDHRTMFAVDGEFANGIVYPDQPAKDSPVKFTMCQGTLDGIIDGFVINGIIWAQLIDANVSQAPYNDVEFPSELDFAPVITEDVTIDGPYVVDDIESYYWLSVPDIYEFETGPAFYVGISLTRTRPDGGTNNTLNTRGIRAALIPITPGDTNRDGTIAIDDFETMAGNFNNSGSTWTDGDFTGDGVVGLEDFLLLRENYVPAVSVQAVPEPSSAMLLLAGLFVMVRIRHARER